MTSLPDGGAVRTMTRWGDPVMHGPCEAVTNFDAGLAATIDWYRANEDWWRPAKAATEEKYSAQA